MLATASKRKLQRVRGAVLVLSNLDANYDYSAKTHTPYACSVCRRATLVSRNTRRPLPTHTHTHSSSTRYILGCLPLRALVLV